MLVSEYKQLVNEGIEDVMRFWDEVSLPNTLNNIDILRKVLEKRELLELVCLASEGQVVHIDMIAALERRGYLIVNKQGFVRKIDKS